MNETIPDFGSFSSAMAEQNWPLVVGIALTIIVWGFRKFLIKQIPKKTLPWISLALAVAGTAGTRIVQTCSDGQPWWHGMIQGILEGTVMGFTAMGAWDLKQTMRKSQ